MSNPCFRLISTSEDCVTPLPPLLPSSPSIIDNPRLADMFGLGLMLAWFGLFAAFCFLKFCNRPNDNVVDLEAQTDPPQTSMVFTYRIKNSNNNNSSNLNTDDEDLHQCSICLEEFKDGEECRLLAKCKHPFHKQCVDKWLTNKESKPPCPLCRACVQSIQTEQENQVDSTA
ncbi:unnamed protein product [Prunus armeniaca]|uniref:RING-type domain-containing protein n=1 Tax=Prunus armeniaca TaxID=36596 RepID=A0A6J5XG04_PRUAR|nr:hypothetical protein GBA52_021205 [Prunus armeniaca]CAB4312876.1 unnamed protein product [Prunus armeniaca]